MGEVFRARDTRLGRDVAIKALPPGFAQDPERLARFEREAKLLASLSHPNIAGIHGLEVVGGERYLILEFVEGETLGARLERGPLPLHDVLDVGKQIAAGVEAAHESGVVHRDLKPGNVMITPSGAVKVLDFGLARSGATEGTGSDPNISASPTMTFMGTQAGVILGTAAYMSPEQARGRMVDRRTDIWSFGCVLYECLTGKQAFEGDTVSDVVARILEREPDWSALPVATPGRLRDLLQRCLRKDARERLRDMGEARVALDEMSRGAGAGKEERAHAKPGRRMPVAFMIALVAVTAVLSVVVTRIVWRSPAPREIALSVVLSRGTSLEGGLENNVLAIAPDGQSLAYTARSTEAQRLFLRQLDQPDAVEMPGTIDARNPFFSPDGEWVAFCAGRKLKKISVRGGTPVELADVAADRAGTWLDDGSIVYSPSFASPLYRIGANGGEPVAITTIDSTRNERTHRWPDGLPGSEWVVFTVGLVNSPGGYDDASIDAVSLKTGERRNLARGSCARYAPGNRLVFARGGSLYAVPIDPADPRGGATAVPVLDGVRGVSTSGIAFFDIAGDGTLAVVIGREARRGSRLGWMDRAGTVTMIPGEPRNYNQVDISPDGTRALVQIGLGGGTDDIFLMDLASGNLNQITFGSNSASPRWMPDGEHIVFGQSSGSGGTQIVLRDLFGSDANRVLLETALPVMISSVMPDGSGILYTEYGSVEGDVLMVPADGSGEVHKLVSGPLSQSSGVVSPDGRWVAYVSDETGVREVCARPLGSSGSRVQISSGGGTKPLWAPDGHEIYYISGATMVAVKLVVRGGVMFADSSQPLFAVSAGLNTDGSTTGVAVHPSGKKFLVQVGSDDSGEMHDISVRLNWAASLDSPMGGKGR
jgi:serine/threonine-protein kinase